jgi:methylglyoxal synthase
LITRAAWGEPMPKSIMVQSSVRRIDDPEIALQDLASGPLGKGLDVLAEIGDQHVAAKIFQRQLV